MANQRQSTGKFIDAGSKMRTVLTALARHDCGSSTGLCVGRGAGEVCVLVSETYASCRTVDFQQIRCLGNSDERECSISGGDTDRSPGADATLDPRYEWPKQCLARILGAPRKTCGYFGP